MVLPYHRICILSRQLHRVSRPRGNTQTKLSAPSVHAVKRTVRIVGAATAMLPGRTLPSRFQPRSSLYVWSLNSRRSIRGKPAREGLLVHEEFERRGDSPPDLARKQSTDATVSHQEMQFLRSAVSRVVNHSDIHPSGKPIEGKATGQRLIDRSKTTHQRVANAKVTSRTHSNKSSTDSAVHRPPVAASGRVGHAAYHLAWGNLVCIDFFVIVPSGLHSAVFVHRNYPVCDVTATIRCGEYNDVPLSNSSIFARLNMEHVRDPKCGIHARAFVEKGFHVEIMPPWRRRINGIVCMLPIPLPKGFTSLPDLGEYEPLSAREAASLILLRATSCRGSWLMKLPTLLREPELDF